MVLTHFTVLPSSSFSLTSGSAFSKALFSASSSSYPSKIKIKSNKWAQCSACRIPLTSPRASAIFVWGKFFIMPTFPLATQFFKMICSVWKANIKYGKLNLYLDFSCITLKVWKILEHWSATVTISGYSKANNTQFLN